MIYVKLMGRGDVNVTDVQTSSYNFKGFEGKIFAFCNGYFWGGCSSVCKVPLYKTRVLDPATDPMAGSRTHNTIKYINTIKFETSEGVLEQDTSKIPNPPNAQSTCWEQLTYPDRICVYVHVKQCKNISPPWRLIKYDSSPIFFFFWTLMTGDLP